LACVGQVVEKLRKSGTWLDADSEQTDFARKVFVVHPMDEQLVNQIMKLASRGTFVLFIRSIPGTGKSHLFRTLERGEPAELFEKDPFRAIRRRFSFVNISSASYDFDRLTEKTIVSVPDAAHYADRLEDLRKRVAQGIKKVKGILIAGNTGMLTLDDFLRRLSDELRQMNITVDYASRNIWLKEYGVSDKAHDRLLFAEFNLSILSYLQSILAEGGCEECINKGTVHSISRLEGLLKEPTKRDRIHDLLLAVRLNHPDVYLTPRTLCIFLADTVASLVHREQTDEEIFQSMYYKSAMVSSSYPREYGLSETNVHSCRIEEEEPQRGSHEERRLVKLRHYLSRGSRRMIYDGLLDDFLEKAEPVANIAFKILSTVGENALKNVTYEFRSLASQGTTDVRWAECLFAFPYWRNYLITNCYIGFDLLRDPNQPLKTDLLKWSEKIRPTFIDLKKVGRTQISLPTLDLDLATFRLMRSLAEGFDIDISSDSPETMRLMFFLYEVRECIPMILANILGSEREATMIIAERGGKVENFAT